MDVNIPGSTEFQVRVENRFHDVNSLTRFCVIIIFTTRSCDCVYTIHNVLADINVKSLVDYSDSRRLEKLSFRVSLQYSTGLTNFQCLLLVHTIVHILLKHQAKGYNTEFNVEFTELKDDETFVSA